VHVVVLVVPILVGPLRATVVVFGCVSPLVGHALEFFELAPLVVLVYELTTLMGLFYHISLILYLFMLVFLSFSSVSSFPMCVKITYNQTFSV
jgi:hypothetical protein